jgi:hypothetical protein
MRVEIWLDKTSKPIVFEDAKSTYEKGSFFCVYSGGIVDKYPSDHIFRVRESYE